MGPLNDPSVPKNLEEFRPDGMLGHTLARAIREACRNGQPLNLAARGSSFYVSFRSNPDGLSPRVGYLKPYGAATTSKILTSWRSASPISGESSTPRAGLSRSGPFAAPGTG